MADTIIKMQDAVIRQQKNTILKNATLEINSGEFVYIIGKVGSGKSSFLKTLYAELPLTYGALEVAGFPLKKIKKKNIPMLRRKCGIVFQDFRLLTDRNVYSNLEFVLKATGWKNKKGIKERIGTVLEKVGMSGSEDKMPHQLSGGEQQRIVIARALLNSPPLILADEPTGNIDPETSYQLAELLRDLCSTGKTVIVATHQYDLLEKFPGRVFRCEDGHIFEDMELSHQPHTLSPHDIENIETTSVTEEVTETFTDISPETVEDEKTISSFTEDIVVTTESEIIPEIEEMVKEEKDSFGFELIE